MRWIEALKIYNQGKMWCVPKKGTKEHAEVLAIMRGNGGGKKIETPKATPTTPKKIRPKIEKMATKSDDINKRLKALKELKGKISEKKRTKVVEFLRSVIQKRKATKQDTIQELKIYVEAATKALKTFTPGRYNYEKDGSQFKVLLNTHLPSKQTRTSKALTSWFLKHFCQEEDGRYSLDYQEAAKDFVDMLKNLLVAATTKRGTYKIVYDQDEVPSYYSPRISMENVEELKSIFPDMSLDQESEFDKEDEEMEGDYKYKILVMFPLEEAQKKKSEVAKKIETPEPKKEAPKMSDSEDELEKEIKARGIVIPKRNQLETELAVLEKELSKIKSTLRTAANSDLGMSPSERTNYMIDLSKKEDELEKKIKAKKKELKAVPAEDRLGPSTPPKSIDVDKLYMFQGGSRGSRTGAQVASKVVYQLEGDKMMTKYFIFDSSKYPYQSADIKSTVRRKVVEKETPAGETYYLAEGKTENKLFKYTPSEKELNWIKKGYK